MWLYLAGAILAASQDVSDVTSDAMFETLQTASFNNRKGIIDFSHKKKSTYFENFTASTSITKKC